MRLRWSLALAGLIAAPLAPAAQAPAEVVAADVLAPYQGTTLIAQVAGRSPVATWVRGVIAFPDPDEGPAWYIDSETHIVGTRDGLFALSEGHLTPLTPAATRQHQRRLASRVDVPQRHRRALGDGDPSGKREWLLLTAFDCGPCAEVDEVLHEHSQELAIELHYLFDTLDDDAQVNAQLRNAQCADDSFGAYEQLKIGEPIAAPVACSIPLHATGYASTLLGAAYRPYFINRKSGRVVNWNGDAAALVRELNAATPR